MTTPGNNQLHRKFKVKGTKERYSKVRRQLREVLVARENQVDSS